MINKIDEFVNNIENNKVNIAESIAKAFASELGEDASDYGDYFYNCIKDVGVYLLDSEKYKTKYEKEVLNIISSINKFVGYDTKPYLDKNLKFCLNQEDYLFEENIKNKDENFCDIKNLYDKKSKDYATIGLSFKGFYNLCVQDINIINKLDFYIKKIKSKMNLYKLKKYISYMYDSYVNLNVMADSLKDLTRRYSVKDIDDLLKLHSEVSSFVINDKNLKEEELEILNNNRNDFRRRINKDKGYSLSYFQAKSLLRNIEKLYNDNMYVEIFSNSLFKDFFKKNNIKYTDINIDQVIDIYFNFIGNVGLCFRANFGKTKGNFCFFHDDVLKFDSRGRNKIILHEFIHACEKDSGYSLSFRYRYTWLNEALTEYLAVQSEKYFDCDLVNNKEFKSYDGSIYEVMFSLIYKLKEKNLLRCFIQAKLSDNVELVIDKIGKNNLDLINHCFSLVGENWNNKKNVEENVNKLSLILDKVNKKCR